MTEDVKVKREYRKVKTIVKDVVDANEGLTLAEIVEKTGVIKWQCKSKLDVMVEKGLVSLVDVDGKYHSIKRTKAK